MLSCFKSMFCGLCGNVDSGVQQEEKSPLLSKDFGDENGRCEKCLEQPDSPINSPDVEVNKYSLHPNPKSDKIVSQSTRHLGDSEKQVTFDDESDRKLPEKRDLESAIRRNSKIRKCRKELKACRAVESKVKRAKSLPSTTSVRSQKSAVSHCDDMMCCLRKDSGDLPAWHQQSHHMLRTLITPTDSGFPIMANAPLWRQLEEINLPLDHRPPWIN